MQMAMIRFSSTPCTFSKLAGGIPYKEKGKMGNEQTKKKHQRNMKQNKHEMEVNKQ